MRENLAFNTGLLIAVTMVEISLPSCIGAKGGGRRSECLQIENVNLLKLDFAKACAGTLVA